MTSIDIVLAVLLGLSLLAVGFLALRLKGEKGSQAARLAEVRHERERLFAEADLKTKTESLKLRETFDQEVRKARSEAEESQARLAKREEALEHKLEMLAKKERFLEKSEQTLSERRTTVEQREKELSGALDAERQVLQDLSGLSREQATALLMKRLEQELSGETAQLVDRVQRDAKAQASERVKEILVGAIQRYSSEHTAEHVVTSVPLSSDDVKGRIIGREGRNIRAFEKSTGVTVIVDDTPNSVVLSCFDPIRRELAKRALEKLIVDGRINPARIEELVSETRQELDKIILESGKQAAYAAGVHGLHARELPLIGRLNYRTTFGQNVLEHALEVAQICGNVAGELGLDVQLAKRIGLLHDMGKALDHESEGSHSAVGAEEARRCEEPAVVVNAIAAHHGEVEPPTPYAVILEVVNRVSGKRPGARKDSLDRLVKRMQKLEETAKTFPGVRECFALQAGKELRVMVDPVQVGDRGVGKLCRDIAKKIESELSYPGEVQVTVLREFRGQGTAH